MEEALKKILTSLLTEKYPKIRDFHISGDEFGYTVGVYMKYNDYQRFDINDIKKIKKEIREYAKYVLGNDSRVNHVYFYEPQD